MRKRFNPGPALFIAAALAILYIPIAVMVIFSFNRQEAGVSWTGFTLKWYLELLAHPDAVRAFTNSMVVSGVTTGVSILMGAFAAIGFHRYDFKGKALLDSFLYVPTIVPAMLLGVSLFSFYDICKIPLSKGTIIIAHITFCVPITFNTILSSLSGFDASIEEAARDLGCSELGTIWRVVLPNIVPAMVSSGLLAFTFSFEDVMTSFFVAGPGDQTLSMYIFGQIKTGVKPTLNALSTLVILSMVTLGIVTQALQKREKK
ncbi:MAG: ABC transporter permease [Lachnospiraceae bacterium]|jgi:spermidine/putrescine transport system permease protein|nr:ABC transporter permease [Lachnospiraceae bacterium]